ncbi:MAG TPA: TonB-dependent receptor [Chryseosolibacter sp.]|nr:TonB-dependent receptor [Chryseosolibacter sp.]
MKKELQVHGQLLLFIMRVSLLNIALAVAFISLANAADIAAQVLDKKVTIDLENVTLRTALTRIEHTADVKFLYHSNLISSRDRIELSVSEARLADLLEQILGPRHIRFEAEGNQIILTKETMGLLVESLRDVPQTAAVAITVSGAITGEDNEPLPGVNILVKGTNDGTTSDFDGKYTLQVPDENAVLVFSFIGYETQEIRVGTQTTINVSMVPDTKTLQELVVVGYGEVEKRDITGAVAQVKSEELQAVPVYNVEQALKARAAGVQVTQNSGRPGGRIEVRVRGGNSMIGDNQPLYVVDGFPITGGIEFLNPSDIESIDILKDASATAIYGARGANGVVIITSKRGAAGQKGRVEVSSFYGVQQDTKRYDLLDAKQYAVVANEWLKNGGQAPYFNVDEVQNPGTDWQDVVLRSAPVQDHTISFSGSSEKTRYSLSGNYFDQEGIIINSGVKRGSVRLNLDHEVNNWLKTAVNLNLSRREELSVPVDNGYRGSAVLSAAASAPPTLPVYDENGLPTEIEKAYSFGSSDMRNPLVFAERQTRALSNTFVGNTSFEIKLTDELKFKTLLGLEYVHTLTDAFTPIIYENDRGSASQRSDYRNSFLNENTLNYTKTFNDVHDLNVVAGYTYQTNMSRNFSLGVSGFSNNTTRHYELAAAEVIGTPSSGISEWVLASWLGRVNYSFNDKYLVTASVRADGSSRFGANNRWATFPSVALGWRVSDEAFMQDIALISDLKLRASYGITGNTALSPYQSLDRMSAVRAVYGNQSPVIGFSPSGISNADLKWETTAQTDVGIDLGILDNRVRITADYYKKNTTDLLASVPLPPSVGFGSILRNIGEIENRGFEFSVGADLVATTKLRWDVTASFSANKNKVIELAGGSDILSAGQLSAWSSTNIAREGEPIASFYGYLEDGYTDAGFIKYKDLDGNGVVNSLDRVILGNPLPDFFYGINTNLSYQNFELGVFVEGVQGNEIFHATVGTHGNSFQRGSNQFADVYGNYWTTDNPDPNAKYPKVSAATGIDISDRLIEDGSYLRIKSLRLAYNIPFAKWGIPTFSRAQIYVSGTNLFTFTDYTGLDPEVSTKGVDGSNVATRLEIGHDQSGYPNAKTYAVGLKLNF